MPDFLERIASAPDPTAGQEDLSADAFDFGDEIRPFIEVYQERFFLTHNMAETRDHEGQYRSGLQRYFGNLLPEEIINHPDFNTVAARLADGKRALAIFQQLDPEKMSAVLEKAGYNQTTRFLLWGMMVDFFPANFIFLDKYLDAYINLSRNERANLKTRIEQRIGCAEEIVQNGGLDHAKTLGRIFYRKGQKTLLREDNDLAGLMLMKLKKCLDLAKSRSKQTTMIYIKMLNDIHGLLRDIQGSFRHVDHQAMKDELTVEISELYDFLEKLPEIKENRYMAISFATLARCLDDKVKMENAIVVLWSFIKCGNFDLLTLNTFIVLCNNTGHTDLSRKMLERYEDFYMHDTKERRSYDHSLAVSYLRDGDFEKVIEILSDGNGSMKYPDNLHCVRTFRTAKRKLAMLERKKI